MKLWVPILLILAGCVGKPTRDPAGYDPQTAKYEMNVAGHVPVDLTRFHEIVSESIARFEAQVAPLNNKIKVFMNDPSCINIGYSFEMKALRFCHKEKYASAGLLSEDVIRHELFHGMICDLRPELCDKSVTEEGKDVLAVHEALADFFAHEAQPDNCFGEKFILGAECTRAYHSDSCYSLTVGNHKKGNVLGSHLIEAGVTLESLRDFLLHGNFTSSGLMEAAGVPLTGCFSPQNPPRFEVKTENYPYSTLNKYRLSPGVPLRIDFHPNAAFLALFSAAKMEWTRLESSLGSPFEVKQEGSFKFSVTATAHRATEKHLVQVIHNNKVIAEFNMYLGFKLEN